MIEVVVTDEFSNWFEELDDRTADDVTDSVGLLEERGVDLGFPMSSAIKGTRYPLRELRMNSRGRPLRIFYAFDVERRAVLLIAGDKSGDDRFYRHMIPRAEKVWKEYCREISQME